MKSAKNTDVKQIKPQIYSPLISIFTHLRHNVPLPFQFSNCYQLLSGNYFNGGVRHKPAFDYALDRYVNKFTGNRSILTDVVKYEYTDWWSHHAPTGDAIYDRGAVSGAF